MRIVERKSRYGRDRGEPLFVFEFVDYNELRLYIDGIKRYMENHIIPGEFKTEITAILDKLESRTDDKYANEEYKLSGMLFTNEMIQLLKDISILMVNVL